MFSAKCSLFHPSVLTALLVQLVILCCVSLQKSMRNKILPALTPGGGALRYFLGGYVPPGTPNWHPVLKKISPQIDTPF